MNKPGKNKNPQPNRSGARELFFHALAERPKPEVISALMSQTRLTLKPFQNYLRHAIDSAKKRQTRYKMPWEKIHSSAEISITPLDTIISVPRPNALWRTPWADSSLPDQSKKLMIVNRDEFAKVTHCVRENNFITFEADKQLYSEDKIFWCGQELQLEQQPRTESPETVTTPDGKPLEIRHYKLDGKDRWILIIKGRGFGSELLIDGRLASGIERPWDEDLEYLVDGASRQFPVQSKKIRGDDAPESDHLTGNNHVRFTWKPDKGARPGCWVRLLLPKDIDNEASVDPRAIFFENELKEVWTKERHDPKHVIRVKRVDSESFQMQLERFPPKDSLLMLPVNTHSLSLQQKALRQLVDAPLPHHRGLLRLCENPEKTHWPFGPPKKIDHWLALKDETRNGTKEQREFVQKALATPDFAILEGPPGSGKTTAICELILQLVSSGQRILLCASTNAAIDNVLERLLATHPDLIEALRIGRLERVDEAVQKVQIDNKIDHCLESWKNSPAFSGLDESARKAAVQRILLASANLTCATTMGVNNHPIYSELRKDKSQQDNRLVSAPHWDVLIIDEASKTLLQEFIVPALVAKKWIIVGDVRQLPPFSDRADIVANLREFSEADKPDFDSNLQRACVLLFRLARPQLRKSGLRWLIVEPSKVNDAIVSELQKREGEKLAILRVVSRINQASTCPQIRIDDLRTKKALQLLTCDWLLIDDEIVAQVGNFLPHDFLHHRPLAHALTGPLLTPNHPLLFRQLRWFNHFGKLDKGSAIHERGRTLDTLEDIQNSEQRWLAEHDLAGEIAWRITRRHELRRSRSQKECQRLGEDLEKLLPKSVDVRSVVEEIQDVGLPSIIEVIQEGIGEERSARPSALTLGIKKHHETDFRDRFESLSYQHRMHPEISELPRQLMYADSALRDANTIEQRDQSLAWSFSNFPKRRVWIDIHGSEQQGVNREEVRAIKLQLEQFLKWAKQAGPPKRNNPKTWEVACLCFYLKQERAISDMLRQLTGQDRYSRFSIENVEIVCGTVDRFQGREADLVLLSLRNTKRIGFLDSPNRLNVAITRARQQLVVVGNHSYFKSCHVEELQQLATKTHLCK